MSEGFDDFEENRKNEVNKTGIDLNDNFDLDSIQMKTYITDGKVDWKTLFNDISRCFVNVGNAKAFYIKDYIADTNSYQLVNYKMRAVKERLSDVLIKTDNGEKIKTFDLCELLFNERFYDIRYDNQNVYKKKDVAFYSKDKHVLSLFPGFKYPNVDTVNMDKISLFLDHIKNIIANGRDDLYEYILSWIAFIIQNPGKKTNTCLIILGKEETGKTAFTTIICKLFSDYALPNIANIDNIMGQFNSITENKMLVVLDEINGNKNNLNNKIIHTRLKNLITEYINIINRKGIDQYAAKNVSNYIICSNDFNSIPISEDDRRYVIANVSDRRKGDKTYFDALFESFDEEFYINLFNYFRTLNIRNFDLRNIPMMEKRQSMMRKGLDSFMTYMTKNLDSYLNPTIQRSAVYRHYVDSINKDKNTFVYGEKVFYEKLHEYCMIKQKRLPERKSPSKFYVLKPEYVEMFTNLLDQVDEQSGVDEM